MIPQISSATGNIMEVKTVPYPSLTYFLTDDKILGNVDGLAAIRQAVKHILTTERYAHKIYDDNYGIELQQLIGKNTGYAKTKINNIIINALLQDDRIVDIIITDKKVIELDTLVIDFTVVSVLGEFREELDFKI